MPFIVSCRQHNQRSIGLSFDTICFKEMVRKLFSRPRSKTAGAVSISRPVLHNVDIFPRPDLLPFNNVTTDISAGHSNEKHETAQSRPSRALSRPRLHRQHTNDEKQQPPPPVPSHPFTKRSEVLTPPSSSERKPHKLQKHHRRTTQDASIQPATPEARLQTQVPHSHSTPRTPSSAHPDVRSNSEQYLAKKERHDTPERHSIQPTLKRRPSKWKKMGSLLKSKDHRDAPPLPPGGYQLRVNDMSVDKSSPDQSPIIPKAPQTAREKTFKSALTPTAVPAPKLSLDMPDIHMERYSVMFDRVLPSSPDMSSPERIRSPSPFRAPSALLSRRDKKLQGLNLRSSSRSYSSDQHLQVHHRPSTSASHRGPPQVTRGRTLDAPRTSALTGPGRSPLRRSATAPPSPIKEGQFLSVSKNNSHSTSPSSTASNLSHRRRSLDSIASPGLLDTDTSDEDDDCVDAEDDGDAIVIHAKVPTWEDPNEPKWEIINPRRKTVKPVLKQESSFRGRNHSRKNSRASSLDTPRPSTASAAERRFGSCNRPAVATAAALAGASGSIDDSVVMQRSSRELGKELGKDLGSTAFHPAVSRLSREIPRIPPKSPARSSVTSMTSTSFYQSAQTSPNMTATKSQTHTQGLEEAPLPPPAIPASGQQQQQQRTPYIPSTLSSNVNYEAHTDGEGDVVEVEDPSVVEVSVARSISVSRKTRPRAPGRANGIMFSGKGQLVRSRSKSAGAGRPATRA